MNAEEAREAFEAIFDQLTDPGEFFRFRFWLGNRIWPSIERAVADVVEHVLRQVEQGVPVPVALAAVKSLLRGRVRGLVNIGAQLEAERRNPKPRNGERNAEIFRLHFGQGLTPGRIHGQIQDRWPRCSVENIEAILKREKRRRRRRRR
jgi:hypothetical protein